MVFVKRFSLFILSIGLLLSNGAFCAQSEPVEPFYKRAATKISTFVKKHKWTIIKTACAITATAAVGYLYYRYRQEQIKNLENEKLTKEYVERRDYATYKKTQTDLKTLQSLAAENKEVDQKAVRKQWNQLLLKEESKLRDAVLQTAMDTGEALTKKDAAERLFKEIEKGRLAAKADLHKSSQLLESIDVTWLDIYKDLSIDDRKRLLVAGIKDKYLDRIKVVDKDYLIKIKEQLKNQKLPDKLEELFDLFIANDIHADANIFTSFIIRLSKKLLGHKHETFVLHHEISHIQNKFTCLWMTYLDKNASENFLNYSKFDELTADIIGWLKSGITSTFDGVRNLNPFQTENDGMHPIHAFRYETAFAVLKSMLTGQVPTEIPATWYS